MSGKGHEVDVVRQDASDRPPDRRFPNSTADEAKIKGFFEFPAQEQKSLMDYFWSILHRKWTVALVFVVGLGIAGFIAYTATPYYVSQAVVEINKMSPRSSNLSDLFNLFNQYDLYYQSQVITLSSRGLAEKFLENMAAKKSDESQPKADSTSDSVETPAADTDAVTDGEGSEGASVLEEERRKSASINSVLSRLTVTPVKGTQMIEVEMGASDPLLAREMLDEYLKTFIEMGAQKRDSLDNKMKLWLKRELAESEKRLKESENELLEFTREHDIVVLDSAPNPKIGEFERAGKEWVDSKAERVKLESLEYQKERVLPPQIGSDYLKSLKTQLAALRSEYTAMEAIYSPNYFKMALLNNKIKSTEEAIAELEKDTLSSALETAKQQEAISKEAYETAKQDAIGKNSLTVKYSILKKAVEANEKLYLMLLQRSKQAEMDQGFMGHHIVMTSPPTLPLAPERPRKAKILFMGAVLGLLGGIALALCLELIDNTVQSTQEIQDRLKLPILGAVPVLEREREREGSDPKLASLEFMAHRYPSSPFTDAIRIVENAAAASMPRDSGFSMVVSSALPLEGKTLISVVMGTVVASEKKRVLVIDGDLRNPRIHQVFHGKPGDVGLSDLLTGKTLKLKEAIRQCHIPGLYYMPAGFVPENPVALLKNRRIQDVVEACKKVFDTVIIDAPPILGLVDARILSGYSDGIILVTRAGHTPLEVLREAKDAIVHGQGRLIGIVLNMADQKKAYGSGYYNSKYYNRYYHRYYHRGPDSSPGNGKKQIVDV
ncbi:MAG: polysaccharide biosynthesis tyrosine autokinase [Desulfomonilaceae bacterium]|nr:polysaccharide biosynthesis tyrosine autokinase [Desulfomonilaceae bacterium]